MENFKRRAEIFKNCTLTPDELSKMYGLRIIGTGRCFVNEVDHFFMQRKSDVLHLNLNDILINTLHESALNGFDNLVEITQSEFDTKLKETIEKLDIIKHL